MLKRQNVDVTGDWLPGRDVEMPNAADVNTRYFLRREQCSPQSTPPGYCKKPDIDLENVVALLLRRRITRSQCDSRTNALDGNRRQHYPSKIPSKESGGDSRHYTIS